MLDDPVAALFETITAACVLDGKDRYPKPGAIVERMRPEVRERLKQLTSGQLDKIRPDALGPYR